VTLFQGKKNRQRESMNCFSVDLRRTRQGYDNQKEENLITATGLYLQVHSLKGSLHETIIWANYEDLQSHCHPWRTNIRVTRGVTTLENHYNRAGCPLRTKSCNTLVKWSGYDQRKENKAMLDEQNYGEKEHLEGRKDQCNMETPHTQSQQCLCNTTTAPTADPLYRADSLPESKQPCGSKQGRETNAEKIWFALKEKNQHQPMIHGWHGKSIAGNKAAPLTVHLLLHLFTLYECMTAHHSSDLLTPQSDNLQRKTNPGKNPIAPPCMHTMAGSEVF
jgi:hypothetical protein